MNQPISTDTVEKIETTQKVGGTAVHKETVVASEHVNPKELTINKAIQVVWLITHLIAVVILLRFLFLLFGANLSGFALFIFDVSKPLVFMFQNIFPAPRAAGSYLDTASLLAIGVWYLAGYIVTRIISLFSNMMREE